MNSFKGFAKNSLIYSGGNLLQKSSQLLLIPILTRYLSPAEYGEYASLLAIVGIVTLLTDLGISTSLSRFIHEYWDDEERLAGYLKISFWLRTVSALVGAAIFGFVLLTLWRFILPVTDHAATLSSFVGMIAAGTALVDFTCSYYQAQTQALMFVMGKIGQTALQCILSIVAVVVLELGVVGFFAAQAVGSVTVGFVVAASFWVRCDLRRSIKLEWADLKHNISFGLPLVPHRVSAWFRSAADRVILGKYLPLHVVGVYQLGYNLGNMLGMVVTCLDLAFAPIYYRIRKVFGAQEAQSVLRNYGVCYIFFFGLLAAAVMIFSPQIVSLLAPPSFISAAMVTPLIAYSVFLQGQYTLIVKSLFYLKKTSIVSVTSMAPAILGTIMNLTLVERYGVMVAVWTTVLMYAGSFLMVWTLVGKDEREGFPGLFSLSSNVIIFALALYCTYLRDVRFEWKVTIGQIVLVGGVAIAAWLVTVRCCLEKVVAKMETTE